MLHPSLRLRARAMSFDATPSPFDATPDPIVLRFGPMPLRHALADGVTPRPGRAVVAVWCREALIGRTDHSLAAADVLTRELATIEGAVLEFQVIETPDGGLRGALVAHLDPSLERAVRAIHRADAQDDPAEPWRASATDDEPPAWEQDSASEESPVLLLGLLERLPRDRVHPDDLTSEAASLLGRVFQGHAEDAQSKRDQGTVEDFLKSL